MAAGQVTSTRSFGHLEGFFCSMNVQKQSCCEYSKNCLGCFKSFNTYLCRLKYNPYTKSFQNNTNVKIIVPGFGKTSSVEYLTPKYFNFILSLMPNSIDFSYFYEMVEYFIDCGYTRGETIRAAPYDWRLAAGMSISISECDI